MVSSFGTTNIRVERLPDGSLPSPRKPVYGSTDHVPGGGDITQVTGTGAAVVTYRLWLTQAEFDALTGQLQQTATLTLADVAKGSWWLMDLMDPTAHIGGWISVDALFRENA